MQSFAKLSMLCYLYFFLQEVKSMREDANTSESTAFKLDVELRVLRALLERAESDARGDGRAFKDIIQV